MILHSFLSHPLQPNIISDSFGEIRKVEYFMRPDYFVKFIKFLFYRQIQNTNKLRIFVHSIGKINKKRY